MTKTDNVIAAISSITSKFLRIYAALTEADLIRGKNGRALYHDWSPMSRKYRDEDRRQSNRTHKVKG